MNARELILGSIRRSLGATGMEAPRRLEVAARLSGHPAGVVPARGQLLAAERLDLFERMVKGAAGSVERVATTATIPAAITAFLRNHNLPPQLRHGQDPRLAAVPWNAEPALEIRSGAAEASDHAAVSHAFAGVAETGTVVLTSGVDNPTTLNFLPDVHIVVVSAEDVVGDLETVMTRLRERSGTGSLPRAVNFITGPSRSADIEQTLILGAHGPRKLHVIMVGAERVARAGLL